MQVHIQKLNKKKPASRLEPQGIEGNQKIHFAAVVIP